MDAEPLHQKSSLSKKSRRLFSWGLEKQALEVALDQCVESFREPEAEVAAPKEAVEDPV